MIVHGVYPIEYFSDLEPFPHNLGVSPWRMLYMNLIIRIVVVSMHVFDLFDLFMVLKRIL